MRVWVPAAIPRLVLRPSYHVCAELHFVKTRKLHWLIDTKVKADYWRAFAITAAIMTLPIKAVSAYIVPIPADGLLLCRVSTLVTFSVCTMYPFKATCRSAIMSWGGTPGAQRITGMNC